MSLQGKDRYRRPGDHQNGQEFRPLQRRWALPSKRLSWRWRTRDLTAPIWTACWLTPGLTCGSDPMASFFALQQSMGMKTSACPPTINAGGASAAAVVMHARMAIAAGMANVGRLRLCRRSAQAAHSECERAAEPAPPTVFARGLDAAYGAVRRQLRTMRWWRSVTCICTAPRSDQLGAIAMPQRKWANLNPIGPVLRGAADAGGLPRLALGRGTACICYDCCLVSNGAVCVIVTSAERARASRNRRSISSAWDRAIPGGDPVDTLISGAPIAKETAFKMAGVELKDIDVAELYDCYTITVLVTLEDYGFCKKGEGGPFVADGRLGPGGSIPVNTGGGELSSYYMWGMTPLSEGVIQVRGEGGERQAPKHDLCLVSGNGGILSTHSTLVLGTAP